MDGNDAPPFPRRWRGARRQARFAPCRSCLKSRPSAAGSPPDCRGGGLSGCCSAGRICAFPCRPASPSVSPGGAIERIDRRAKYILVHLDDGLVLICHLGMTGRMLLGKGEPELEIHDHIVFYAEGDCDAALQRCAALRHSMDLTTEAKLGKHKLLEGPGAGAAGRRVRRAAAGRGPRRQATPIKAPLLDQRVVAGIGNIYVSEALFRAGISPRRLARTVQGERAERLARGDHRGAERGDRGRRIVPARLCSDRWRARLFPASLARSMSMRGSAARAATATRGDRRHQAHRAGRPRELLLPQPSAISCHRRRAEALDGAPASLFKRLRSSIPGDSMAYQNILVETRGASASSRSTGRRR